MSDIIKCTTYGCTSKAGYATSSKCWVCRNAIEESIQSKDDKIKHRDARIAELEYYQKMWRKIGGAANLKQLVSDNKKLEQQNKQLAEALSDALEDCREAISTAWRFVNAYKGNNMVPIDGALKSAEYHLGKTEWIFEPVDKHQETIELAKQILEGE